jgi:hypothetical protein
MSLLLAKIEIPYQPPVYHDQVGKKVNHPPSQIHFLRAELSHTSRLQMTPKDCL